MADTMRNSIARRLAGGTAIGWVRCRFRLLNSAVSVGPIFGCTLGRQNSRPGASSPTGSSQTAHRSLWIDSKVWGSGDRQNRLRISLAVSCRSVPPSAANRLARFCFSKSLLTVR